jgi:pilus assembly protein CpaC
MKNQKLAPLSISRRSLGVAQAVVIGAALGWLVPSSAQVAVEYGKSAATVGAPVAVGAAAAGKAVAAKTVVKTDAPATTKVEPAKAKPAKAQAAKTPSAAEPPLSGPICLGDLPAPVTINLAAGKSTLVKLPAPITMRTLGDDEVVQARLLSPQAIYLLGVSPGSTNMVLQDASGRCTLVDVAVGMDSTGLQAKLAQLLPDEKGIQVTSAADTVVLTGVASDAVRVEQAVMLANAYVRGSLDKGRLAAGGAGSGGGAGGSAALGGQSARVVNMLSVASPQQVMLEVKVAEVSKALIDKLGAALNLQRVSGGWAYTILADFLTGSGGIIDAFKKATGEFITIDGENKDGLVKILAEPNLMAMSGQEGSFLAGGKVYFPVAQGSSAGGIIGGTVPITLQEENFGVGLKFTPTVLEGGRINLKVTPEVSELAPEGVAIQAVNAGGRTIAPLITTRRASTTVQLYDGQSFAIGGLIKYNVRTDIKAFPVLGEIPIIGALFRSSAFQTDKTELLFVVTPHLVKPMAGKVRLPTDSYVEPSRLDFFLGGRMEGPPPEPASLVPAPIPNPAPAAPRSPSGFEIK